jgi:hypothetical protein
MIHEGTRPHTITAKNKKALFFVKNGVGFMVPKTPHKVPGWMIRSGLVGNGTGNIKWSQKGYVDHPGTKPDKFLYEAADRLRQKIINDISRAIKAALRAV